LMREKIKNLLWVVRQNLCRKSCEFEASELLARV
jgi:hypothetical protein